MKIVKKILSERYIFDSEKIDKKSLHYNLLQDIIVSVKKKNSRNLRNSCPACNNVSAEIISERDRYGLPITFMICLDCDFIFSREYFCEDFMISYYKSTYNKFSQSKSPEKLFSERTNLQSPSFERYKFIKKILKDKFDDIKIVMEPGCNDGCNLYQFLKNGKEVLGCDFDDKRITVGQQAGINILKGGIEKLIETRKKADLIILPHVLAHVTNLNEFINDIKKLLNPNGFIYIETPGFRGWWDKIKILRNYRKNFLNFIHFEFCYIFDLNLLKSFLLKFNFKLFYGDEYIKSIFRLNTLMPNDIIEKKYFNLRKKEKSNIEYLQNMEKKYLKFLFFKKKFFNLFK